MIKLAGFKLDQDIQIEFTGLRAGEKMFEELFKEDEERIKTSNEKIFVSKTRVLNQDFNKKLNNLLVMNYSTPREHVILTLQDLVPEFSPQNSNKEISVH